MTSRKSVRSCVSAGGRRATEEDGAFDCRFLRCKGGEAEMRSTTSWLCLWLWLLWTLFVAVAAAFVVVVVFQDTWRGRFRLLDEGLAAGLRFKSLLSSLSVSSSSNMLTTRGVEGRAANFKVVVVVVEDGGGGGFFLLEKVVILDEEEDAAAGGAAESFRSLSSSSEEQRS